MASHVEHNVQGTPPHHGFSLLINVECVCVCRTLSLSVLYSVRCQDGITFQIEWMHMNQSQKSLRQSKIPDFFAAK